VSKRKITEAIRELVEERAAYRCEYCQTTLEISTQRFEIEHIKALAKGGTNDLSNLALSCRGCNAHKHSKIKGFDEITGKKVFLYNPREDHWPEHFAWDQNPLYLLGLTPRGRATIGALKMNRAQLISVRSLLQQLHKHPPVW
jgi:hypothetical protein